MLDSINDCCKMNILKRFLNDSYVMNLEMLGSGFMSKSNPVWYGVTAGWNDHNVNKIGGWYLLDVNLASADWPLRRKEAASHIAMAKTSF